MIDLYYFITPNGLKLTIYLEEAGLDYAIKLVDITKDEQHAPAFLAISPNNRIPAIVDNQPLIGSEPMVMFESGAILEYLGDKTGRLLPAIGTRQRYTVLQWLYWQMGGLGPMAGQNHHFRRSAPQPIDYAIERYAKETRRLYTVLNTRLQGRKFVADEYSIADIASFPWVGRHDWQEIALADYPNVQHWYERIAARPAVQRAMQLAEDYRRQLHS